MIVGVAHLRMRPTPYSLLPTPYLLVGLAWLLLAGCSHKKAAEPILIGHPNPHTGAEQWIGDHETQGILLAVEEANQEGNGVAGRSVEVLHPDTGSDPGQWQPEVVRLLTVNKAAALLLGTGAEGLPGLSSEAQLYHAPLLTPGALPVGSEDDYVFVTGLTPVRQGQFLAQFAAKKLKAASVLVLAAGEKHSPRAAVRNSVLVDAFVKELGPKAGLPHFFQSTVGFKDLISGQKPPPAAVLLAGSAEDLQELLKAGLDEKIPILWGGEDGSLKAVQAVQPTNVVYLPTVFVTQGAGPRADAFVKKYQDRFQESPDVHAALAYDDARLLVDAMRQANSSEGPKVQPVLAGLKDYPSLTGPLSFRKDHVADRPLFLIRLQNGQAETEKVTR